MILSKIIIDDDCSSLFRSRPFGEANTPRYFITQPFNKLML